MLESIKLISWLALCCAQICGCVASAVSDEHLDRLLLDTDREVRSWYQNTPIEIASQNVSARSYRKWVAPEIHELGVRTAVLAYAADRLSKRYNLPRDEADMLIQSRAAPRQGIDLNDLCNRATPTCDNAATNPFRTEDGSCNNLRSPTLGMAISRFERYLPAQYADANGAFRRGVTKGEDLPAPRVIRTNIHPDVSRPDGLVTNMIVGFGQFLDHDITSTPDNQNLACCGANKNNPECIPIEIPSTDAFYSQFKVRCLQMSRSIRACGAGQRNQINQATAFIDGSQIYGVSKAETTSLRSFVGGMLLSDTSNRLLPNDTQICGDASQGIKCFRAGDARVNENPALASMHTIWLREHNRIAQGLRIINPDWRDERLFQESKRMVVAQLQNIVYSEYLPLVIGPAAMSRYKLNLPPGGIGANTTSTYDANAVPAILNSFAAAAYRFGHSLIQSVYLMTGNDKFALENNFDNLQLIYNLRANIDRIVKGLSQQPAQSCDHYMSGAVSNHLFQAPDGRFGSDLAARNIQRGRDHGLQSYNNYRGICQLTRANNFDQLEAIFGNQDLANHFREAYKNVNDIDLWPAGISETPVANGIVGDTFACIIGDQFKRLFRGDRYFFTHGNQAGSFSAKQLENLRQRTLASVLCDNASPTVTNLQRNVFLQSGYREYCSNLPKLILNNWKAN